MMVAMHMGKPVFRGATQPARRYAESQTRSMHGDRPLEWTDSGKLMVVQGDGKRRRFTGWEITHIPHLRNLK